MNEQFNHIQIAQWILDKQLVWIASADAKVAVIISLETAALAGIATAYSSSLSTTHWALLLSILTSALIFISLFCAAMSVIPRTDGPKESIIFFTPIAKISQVEFVDKLIATPLDKIHKEIAIQIHRNAEIANRKHCWVKRSMGWAFFAAIPWTSAVFMLIKK